MGKPNFLTKSKNSNQRDSSYKSNKRGGFKNNSKNRNYRKGNKPFIREGNPEDATPWTKLKEAFLEQEKEIKEKYQENNKERDAALKSRKQNYQKFLINEKQKEDTVWEEITPEKNEDHHEPNSNAEKKKEKPYYRNNFIKQLENNQEIDSTGKKRLKMLITKATTKANGISFFGALDDLKYRGVKPF